MHCGNWVAFFALLSLLLLAMPLGVFLFPLVLCLSTAVQSFSLLVFGPRGAALSLSLAFLVLILVGVMAGISTFQAVVFFSLFWIPASLISLAWLRTKVLPIGLLTAAALSILLILTIHGLFGADLVVGKSKATELILSLLAERQLKTDPQAIETMFKYTVGIVSSAFYIVWICSVFLGKYWANEFQDTKSLGNEFYQIRNGKILLLPIALLIGLGLLTKGQPSIVYIEIAAGLCLLYAIQGLAVAHRLTAKKMVSSGWLWGLYALLFFAFLPTGILLSLVGAGDNWLDIRTKTS